MMLSWSTMKNGGHVVAVFDTEQEADDYVENTHPCTYDSWFEVREE